MFLVIASYFITYNNFRNEILGTISFKISFNHIVKSRKREIEEHYSFPEKISEVGRRGSGRLLPDDFIKLLIPEHIFKHLKNKNYMDRSSK